MNADCTDTIGGFECTCNSGCEGEGVNCTSMYMSLKIIQMWECYRTHKFDCTVQHHVLFVIMALFSSCSDINECVLSSLNDCDGNADCIDTIGSYNCSCNPGYEGDGFNCTGYTIM